MYQTNKPLAPTNRRAVILVVVLLLLALFAVVALSFVLYADAAATAARLNRESEVPFTPNVEPELLLSNILGQMIYDGDNTNGIYSSLRGQSFARNMYGLNYNSFNVTPNVYPFNGVGRMHFTNVLGVDDYNCINYMYFPNIDVGVQQRNPEIFGPVGSSYYGSNVSYTYPDINNLYLAQIAGDMDTASYTPGQVILPSFHRPNLASGFGAFLDAHGNPSNPNWTNAVGKYLTLRPRPIDHYIDPTTNQPVFPYPEDNGGDVKNLTGAPGGNDSIWIDPGLPVMTAPDGRMYKALVAPLVVDLDGRINLQVHGGVRGYGGGGPSYSPSHQGWGPWEVNPQWLFSTSPMPTEWANLFRGTQNPTQNGRYGFDQQPATSGNQAPSWSNYPRFYRPANFDGAATQANGTYIIGTPPIIPVSPILPLSGVPSPSSPTLGKNSNFSPFPVYDTTTTPTTPGTYGNGNAAELTNHPLLYNPFIPTYGDDRVFALSNQEALLRYSGTGSSTLTSEVFRMCPQSFNPNNNATLSAALQRMVTLRSFDVTRPGATPWVPGYSKLTAAQKYQVRGKAFNPTGAPIPTPGLPGAASPGPGTTSEFNGDWRSINAALGRVNLNRPLPNYPSPNAITGRIDMTNATTAAAYNVALQARQQFASDIFQVLVKVTGATPLATVTYQSLEYNALRWLAQLAVNIVDYIDNDDYITWWQWDTNPSHSDPGIYVYGTELPRTVVNEVYVELDNGTITNSNWPGYDPGLAKAKGMIKPVATLGKVNVWVELLNTFQTDTAGGMAPAAKKTFRDGNTYLEFQSSTGRGHYGAYQVIITNKVISAALITANNTTGDPQFVAGDVYSIVGNQPGTGGANFDIDSYALPGLPGPRNFNQYISPLANPGFVGTPGSNNGFYLLSPAITETGPKQFENNPFTPLQSGGSSYPFATLQRHEMSYILPLPANTTMANLASSTQTSVLLRRLACPNLDPNPATYGGTVNPNLPYNPYITVDYVLGVPTNFGAKVDEKGNSPAANQTPVQKRWSWGRTQPYAANSNGWLPDPLTGSASSAPPTQTWQQQRGPYPYTPPFTPYTTQPQHTFYQQNANANTPAPANNTDLSKYPAFDWLVQIDHMLISPMELLNVSGFPPHQLTQQFFSGGSPGGHYAPWFDQHARIYRALEFLTTGEQMLVLTPLALNLTTAAAITANANSAQSVNLNGPVVGTTPSGTLYQIGPGSWLGIDTGNNLELVQVTQASGTQITAIFQMSHAKGVQVCPIVLDQRVPGKININTVRDWEIFKAVADPSNANLFNLGQVTAAFQSLIQNRDSGYPFCSLAAGYVPSGDSLYPNGLGINNTILRGTLNGNIVTPSLKLTPAPGAPPTNPYQQFELLTKTYNQFTTRSNVFAVWLTVGFFQVTDPTTRPVTLARKWVRARGRMCGTACSPSWTGPASRRRRRPRP